MEHTILIDTQIREEKRLRCILESWYTLSWKEPFKTHLDQGPAKAVAASQWVPWPQNTFSNKAQKPHTG